MTALAAVLCIMLQPIGEDPVTVETGAVRWHRNLERAQHTAARDGKPVLLLFQEIPG